MRASERRRARALGEYAILRKLLLIWSSFPMREPAALDLIRRFRAGAEAALPGRIARVVLFGSRARSAARSDSDWDLAVFLRDRASCDDLMQLADVAYDLILETGQAIHPIALAEDGRDAPTLLLREIARDGIGI